MPDKQDLAHTFRYAKGIAVLILVLLLVIYLVSGLYAVKPHQRGVVKQFGRVTDDNVPPGIHYHWPWPIETVQCPETTEIRSLVVRFRPYGGGDISEVATSLLTGDENLVLADVILQFTISQAKAYLNTTADPEQLLGRLVRDACINRFAEAFVDDILTTRRHEIQTQLRADVQAKADAYQLGVRITAAQLQKVEPPGPVAGKFRDVASAREDKQKKVQQANGERNRRLPGARAEAERMLRDAEAHVSEVLETARGDAERFMLRREQYASAKSVTAQRLYLETVEEVLGRVRKVIADPAAEQLR